jgi:hypothetical protein
MGELSVAAGAPVKTPLASPQMIMLAGLCAMYMITYVDRVNLSRSTAAVSEEHR